MWKIVAALLVFLFVIVLIYGFSIWKKSQVSEEYTDNKEASTNSLLDKSKISVAMGTGYPPVPPTAVNFDQHPSLPSVDGTSDAPKAMFMMAYNKCDPGCCPSTFSCGHGCVCMTEEQKKFIANRGRSSKN